MSDKLKYSKSLAKLNIHLLGALEAMDELENTSVYNHKVKQLCKNLDKSLAKYNAINIKDANDVLLQISKLSDAVIEGIVK